MWGKMIQAFRKRIGLSQYQLAEMLDVSQATIASWEIGTRNPPLDKIIAMAQLFGCTTDQLLCFEPNANAGQPQLIGRLSSEENELIDLLYGLSPQLRRVLFALAKTLLQVQESERGSRRQESDTESEKP